MAVATPFKSTASVRWPRHLQGLARKFQKADAVERSSLREEIWLTIQTVIAGYARLHASRMGALSPADIADVSAQKSLDLLLRLDTEQWNPVPESEGRVRAFLSTVARNGVVDALRDGGRTEAYADPENPALGVCPNSVNSGRSLQPANRVEAAEFVDGLQACVGQLSPRARRLWFMRALYEMPSRKIADHPEIQMSVGSVDVALQRCRRALGECMEGKSLKLRVLPPGTFAALYELCLKSGAAPMEEEGHG